MPLSEPELVAENLACRRGERLVFSGLSFRLEGGGALLVKGPNGSGKSSLLRLLATLIRPAEGRLLWGAVAVEKDLSAYRQSLLYVGHQDALKAALTARETLGFWAALRGMRGAKGAVETALQTFALDAIADWPNRWLSAGQKRRVALARLVAAPAPLWLLDEPFVSLDHDNQNELERAIEAHREKGGRVVVASHQKLTLPDAQSLELEFA